MVQELTPVARTMMIPLWARAAETRKRRPVVRDERALEICEGVDFDFGIFRYAYGTQIGCVLRSLLFDRWVEDFLVRHPDGTVVELGAGLSTRFERIDNGRAQWVDVDLPDAIALRRRHVAPAPRRTLFAASVLDPGWLANVREIAPAPYYFVAEGMMMYLDANDVRDVLVRIADTFGPTEIALDSIGSLVVRHQAFHDSMRHMLDAPFRWGIDDVREIERWDDRLSVVEAATLPDIARRFSDVVAFPQRLAGIVADRMLPRLASAYRLTRIAISASTSPGSRRRPRP